MNDETDATQLECFCICPFQHLHEAVNGEVHQVSHAHVSVPSRDEDVLFFLGLHGRPGSLGTSREADWGRDLKVGSGLIGTALICRIQMALVWALMGV